MKHLEARLIDNTHLELKEPVPKGLDEVVVKIEKLMPLQLIIPEKFKLSPPHPTLSPWGRGLR